MANKVGNAIDLGLTPAEASDEQSRPYHPDSVVNDEVIADRDAGRAVDLSAGIREGWHRGWGVGGARATQ